MDLAALRQEYMRAGLHEKDLHADPLAQFGSWFDEALQSGIALPNAMTLATATKKGRPSARAVLLKGFDALGFVFYTHYRSRQGPPPRPAVLPQGRGRLENRTAGALRATSRSVGRRRCGGAARPGKPRDALGQRAATTICFWNSAAV